MDLNSLTDLQKHRVGDLAATVFYIPDFITEEEEKFLLKKVYDSPKPKWTQLAHRRLQNWGGLPHPKGMVAETLPEWLQGYVNKLSCLDLFKNNKPNHVLVNEYLPGQGIMPHEDGPLFYPVVSTISLGSHTVLDFYHHRSSRQESTENGQDKVTKDEIRENPVGNCQNKALDNQSDREQTSDTSKQNVAAVNQDSEDCFTAVKKSNNNTKTVESDSAADGYFKSVLLERRSLVLVCEEMYCSHLHGIAERECDTITNSIANLQSLSNPVSPGDQLHRDTRVSLTIRHVPRTIKSKFMFGRR